MAKLDDIMQTADLKTAFALNRDAVLAAAALLIRDDSDRLVDLFEWLPGGTKTAGMATLLRKRSWYAEMLALAIADVIRTDPEYVAELLEAFLYRDEQGDGTPNLTVIAGGKAIPPHRPDVIRLLLPTDDVIVIPMSGLAPGTLTNLDDALRAAQLRKDHEPTE